MKTWSKGYELIRLYVRFAFWLTHGKIVVTGRELIPQNKPIIFAPNHQNALMDPLALACTNRFQTVWLARADIFKSKTVDRILRYLKLLPVYRIRDGKENLSNNEQIFEQVTRLLENRQTVALFPEAAHSGRRQMLPHKKAIPRIALEAEEKNKFSLNLQIVPVGIFYSHYWWFNRTLIVQYGKSIEVDKYREEYVENPQKAMLSLRDEIYARLRPLTLHIASETHYDDYENMRQVAGKAFAKTRSFSKNSTMQQFLAEKELIVRLENLEAESPGQFKSLLTECSGYFEAVAAAGSSDKQVVCAGETSLFKLTGKILASLLTLPLFAFGFIFNAVPFFVPRRILRRKVKNITFLSTFNFVAGLIFFPLFYIPEATLVGLLTGSWIAAFLCLILMPFAGKIAWRLLEYYRLVFAEISFPAGGKTSGRKLKSLYNQRNELIRSIMERITITD